MTLRRHCSPFEDRTLCGPAFLFALSALLVVLAPLLPIYRPVQAQSTPRYAEAGRFHLQHFDADTYRAHTQNWNITQDHRGVMYFANNQGVLEFDGASWRLVRTSNHSVVRSLATDEQGRVYVGALGELGYLEADATGQLQYVSLMDEIPAADRDFSDVWQTVATSHGVYFCTLNRLFRWSRHDGMHVWRSEAGFKQMQAVRDTIYVSEKDRGLLRLLDDSLHPVSGGAYFTDKNRLIYTILPLGTSDLLIGTNYDGLYRYDGSSFEPYPTEADTLLRENWLYDGARLPGDLLALATIRGGVVLLTVSGELVRVLDNDEGLPEPSVYHLYPDRREGLWLALNHGLARIAISSPMSYFDETTGLEGAPLVTQRHRGRLYTATTMGVFRLSPSKPTFTPVEGLREGCWDLLPTENALLAGCQYGVHQIVDERASPLRKSKTTFALHRSRLDTTWVYVGMRDGLALLHLENGRWVDYGRVTGIDEMIRDIQETSDGNAWLTTQFEGLLQVDFSAGFEHPPAVARFDTTHGLPNGWSRVFLLDGRLVFGTNEGLYRFNADTTAPRATFTPDATLGEDYANGSWIMELAEDRNGDLWILGDRKQIARRQADGSYSQEPVSGLPLSLWNHILAEDDGTVWISRTPDLIRFDLSIPKPQSPPLETLIRRVATLSTDSLLYGGTPDAPLPTPQLSYHHNDLRFEFTTPTFEEVGILHHQYYLEGLDPSWSTWASTTIKEYTHLPEGDYVFHVRARNAQGEVGQEARYAFIILPPWYRTGWAYSLYGLATLSIITGLVFGYSRHRTRRLQARNDELEQQVAVRTQELDEINKRLEVRVQERTTELKQANVALQLEVAEREQAEQALRDALAEVEQLKDRLQAENVYLQEEIRLTHNFTEIIGESPALKKVLRKAEQVAPTDASVLILGETGTGKELIARAIHDLSARQDRPLVKVNCAALPASLIESELFGHEKGAFTGATGRKIGRFELADGATILLDEIGELPLALQTKLLRVLQEGEFERLGSCRTLQVGVRVLAITNRDLSRAVERGDFREDLYHRLNVFPITLPPLRQRAEDIPLLVRHFIAKYEKKLGMQIETIPRQAMHALQAYSWPGNIRELANMIERAMILAEDGTLRLEEAFEHKQDFCTRLEYEHTQTLEEVERRYILRVLKELGWRVSGSQGAAERLGLPPSTLRSRMKKLGIERPSSA